MKYKRYFLTSESVTEGHPDKVCDLISDSILDECLKQDKESRVAVETLITANKVIVAGEITTNAKIDIENDDSIETKVVVFSGEMNYIAKAKNYNCVISYLTKILCFEEIGVRIKQIAQDIGGKSINQKILEYLLDLGFSTSKQGTIYLKDCIRMFLLKREEECKVKELFKMVASTNGVPSYRVKNNIHTSTRTVWNLGNQEHIIEKLKLGYTEEMSPKKVITMAQYYIDID